jgi:hypothetical protein
LVIVNETDYQFMFAVNKSIESRLVSEDYEQFSQEDKNDLIMIIAQKNGLLLNEVTPEVILEYHKQLKIKELNQTCDDTISAGFTASNGHTYRTNRDDQINMIGQKDDLSDATIEVVSWKTEDIGYIDHTRDEWLSVYGQAFAYKKNQLLHYNSLKKTVTDCTSHPDILAVVW